MSNIPFDTLNALRWAGIGQEKEMGVFIADYPHFTILNNLCGFHLFNDVVAYNILVI